MVFKFAQCHKRGEIQILICDDYTIYYIIKKKLRHNIGLKYINYNRKRIEKMPIKSQYIMKKNSDFFSQFQYKIKYQKIKKLFVF